jgi:hypothetical protein
VCAELVETCLHGREGWPTGMCVQRSTSILSCDHRLHSPLVHGSPSWEIATPAHVWVIVPSLPKSACPLSSFLTLIQAFFSDWDRAHSQSVRSICAVAGSLRCTVRSTLGRPPHPKSFFTPSRAVHSELRSLSTPRCDGEGRKRTRWARQHHFARGVRNLFGVLLIYFGLDGECRRHRADCTGVHTIAHKRTRQSRVEREATR